MSDKEVYLKRITKGALIVFIGMNLGKLISYFLRMFIARSFGPEDFGLFSLVSAIFGIVTTLALLGLPRGVERFLPFYLGKDDKAKAKGVVFSAFKIMLPLGVLAFIIIYFFADVISVYAFNEPALTPLLQLFAFSIPLSMILSILIGSFKGFQNMRNKALIEDITRPLSTILVLLFIFFFIYSGINGTAYAYFFGYLIAALLGTYLLRSNLKSLGKDIKHVPRGRELLIFSWPLIMANYLGMVIKWTDTMMLGIFTSSDIVGLYNVALLTSNLLFSIMMPLIYIFLPVITEIYAKGKKEELSEVYSSVLKWGFAATLPFFLLILFFSDNVLSVLYGQEYVAAALPLIILSIGQMFLLFSRPSSNMLIMMGKTKLSLLVTSIGTVLNIILNVALIPIWGMYGAAVATASTFLLIALLNVFFSQRHLDIRVFRLDQLKALVAGGVSMSVFYFSIKLFYSNPPVWLLAISFPFFILLYGLLFLVMRGFDENDAIIMRSIEKKTGIGFGPLKGIIKRFI
jgi:O-antigen/teichoic acid export membrane protein